jgi:hypothetical protein
MARVADQKDRGRTAPFQIGAYIGFSWVLIWATWALWGCTGRDSQDLGVLFSGLALGAVAATLFVQLGELSSQREVSDRTLQYLMGQTDALQEQVLYLQVETRIGALNSALAALEYRDVDRVVGMDAVEFLHDRWADDIRSDLKAKRLKGWEDLMERWTGLEEAAKRIASSQLPDDAKRLIEQRIKGSTAPLFPLESLRRSTQSESES